MREKEAGWNPYNPDLEEFLSTDRLRGFDLSRPPLMRVTLFGTGELTGILVWTYHHVLLDGRSLPILLNEVLSECSIGNKEPVSDSPRPFEDFITWLGGRDFTDAETYWKEVLRGFGSPTPMVVDRKTDLTSGEDPRGEQEALLSGEAADRLRELAGNAGITLQTIVHGAWALLLSRYSGEHDVVFGATRACRRGTLEGASDMVGLFINTLPVRVRVDEALTVAEWLSSIRANQSEVHRHEHAPLASIQSWSEVAGGVPLFDTIVVFDNQTLDASVKSAVGVTTGLQVRLIENTFFPITLYAYSGDALQVRLVHDRSLISAAAARRMSLHLLSLLEQIARDPEARIASLNAVTSEEWKQSVVEWNRTEVDVPRDQCIHHCFEQQVHRSPEAVALIAGHRELTYAEVNAAADRVASRLQSMGLGPDLVAGVHMERSAEMVIALLGILKAGGAYLPLDPAYPRERLEFMLRDSGATLLLSDGPTGLLPEGLASLVVDGWVFDESVPATVVDSGVSAENLAYVIYTSGSTGLPKGVMVEHGNVLNLFVAMDREIGGDPGVWLSVTSISFDISVLELFWTLSRGFKVVLYQGEDLRRSRSSEASTTPTDSRSIDFSLFYFAGDDGRSRADRYRLLVDGASYADENGFAAVWTPERHFHSFGGLFPSPSVTAAFLAGITERVQIRAGSVVLPLHSTIRVAEEWSVVDNLSGGRIGLSFASGWHDRDFVFAPENYAGRKDLMYREIETFRRLWRGETTRALSGSGQEVEVAIYPRPIQPEPPIWVTAGGDPDTFVRAGRIGANLLTHLLGQSLEELEAKLKLYRDARSAAGHGPGHATLMLHTFVSDSEGYVRDKVREPFLSYIRTSVDLMRKVTRGLDFDVGSGELTEADLRSLAEHAFDRYYQTSGLFGTPQSCRSMIDRLKALGVDEVACLIDFGIDEAVVIESLRHLNRLRRISNAAPESGTLRLARLIETHGVTHLQCTPSMAEMLAVADETLRSLGQIRTLLIGGEALHESLVQRLRSQVRGEIINVYGPTETTVWSTCYRVESPDDPIPVGRPLANTRIYILDARMEPVPVGVPGEIYIGGLGVVRGYLGRSDLTAERFLPDPFAGETGSRLYRTGDIGRYRDDGAVEFLGRADQQVKLRGYRIEPGEIESILEAHPAVRQAVVVVRFPGGGEPRLSSYMILADVGDVTERELERFLEERVPSYMVPDEFVRVDAYPLTPNGKIDRRALMSESREVRSEEQTEPSTPLELALAEIWREVLGVDTVGAQENFFRMGGHSLSAVRIVFRVRQAFDVDIPLQSFFRTPTIQGLARILESLLLERAESLRLDELMIEIEGLSDEEVKMLVGRELERARVSQAGSE